MSMQINRRLETCRPTQRAADKWESARFQAVFNASAGFRFRAWSTTRPPAGNASRSVTLEP
jgi:hypothetical protein